MPFGIPQGLVLSYKGQRLTFQGESSPWMLDIVDENGVPFLLVLPGTEIAIRPDVDWLLRENKAGHLVDPNDPRKALGGRNGEFLGLDRAACVARDPKAAGRYAWALAALGANIQRSEHHAKAFIALDPALVEGPKPKWRSLLRWVSALDRDPHRRIGNLVSVAGRQPGQSQLPRRVDMMVLEEAARYWTADGDSFKADTAARVVARWDELYEEGVPDIGDAPPSEECVRNRINLLQNMTTYAARYGDHAAKRYYGAKGEPVGAEHVLERVTLDGVVFSHVCVFSDDWPIPAARMKGVYAMDWVSQFVFPGATFSGPFRAEATVTALLGLMTRPRLTPEQIAANPKRETCYGLPDTLHPDNEKALLPPGMIPGIINIVSTLELPKVYHSNSKAKHERFHRFAKGCLFRFKGRVLGASTMRDPRYDPLKSADVTRAQYVAMVEAVIRAWNERPKKSLGWRSPMDVFYEGIIKRGRRELPEGELERNLSRTVDVTLTTNGVEYDHIRYRFNERGVEKVLNGNVRRMPFATRLADTGSCTLTARVWDNDLDYIELYNPDDRTYVGLWAVDADYSAGLTRYEHREYHKMLTAGKGGSMKKVDRLRKRHEFLMEREAKMPGMAFRARASTVALLEQEEVRQATGLLGRSEAYDDVACNIRTEIGGANRVDQPKAPPQASTKKKTSKASRREPDPSADPARTVNGDGHGYPVADRNGDEDELDVGGANENIWSDEREADDEDY